MGATDTEIKSSLSRALSSRTYEKHRDSFGRDRPQHFASQHFECAAAKFSNGFHLNPPDLGN